MKRVAGSRVIGMEGAKTPMGDAGNLRARRLRVTPHGKRSTWNGNQHSYLTEPSKRQK